MPKFDVTDHSISYRPTTLRPYVSGYNATWGLSVNGKPIGTVWETEDDKYAGQIQGTTSDGQHRGYTCPRLPSRESVIERLEEMAERIGIA
jgi:hypothetical protein